MATSEDIIAAISQLDEDAGGLDKKPNVADIESILGEDINAAERDDAWKAFQDAQVDDEPDESDESVSDDSEGPVVTNNMASPFTLFDVTIAPKKSKPVPKFDSEKPFIAACIEGGFISVE